MQTKFSVFKIFLIYNRVVVKLVKKKIQQIPLLIVVFPSICNNFYKHLLPHNTILHMYINTHLHLHIVSEICTQIFSTKKYDGELQLFF